MNNSLKQLNQKAIAKGGISLAQPAILYDDLQALKSLIDNMLEVRDIATSICTNHTSVEYTGKLDFAEIQQYIDSIQGCTCDTEEIATCSCVSDTCACNARTYCAAHDTCLCNGEDIGGTMQSTCDCQNDTCSCVGNTSPTVTCHSEYYCTTDTCDCNTLTCATDDEITCDCDTVACTCDSRTTTLPCTCDVEEICDCHARTADYCDCQNRTAISCLCQSDCACEEDDMGCGCESDCYCNGRTTTATCDCDSRTAVVTCNCNVRANSCDCETRTGDLCDCQDHAYSDGLECPGHDVWSDDCGVEHRCPTDVGEIMCTGQADSCPADNGCGCQSNTTSCTCEGRTSCPNNTTCSCNTDIGCDCVANNPCPCNNESCSCNSVSKFE